MTRTGRDPFIQDRRALFLSGFGIAFAYWGKIFRTGFGVTHHDAPLLRCQCREDLEDWGNLYA